MNKQNQGPDMQLTPNLLSSIVDLIAKESNLNIGRKKKQKIFGQIRRNLAAQNQQQNPNSNQQPSTSGQFPNANAGFKPPVNVQPGQPMNTMNLQTTTYTPGNCSQPDEKLFHSAISRHMIMIHHNGKLDKEECLNALNEALKGEVFAAFDYKRGDQVDSFLIQNQPMALKKLFQSGLNLATKVGNVSMEIRTGVAFGGQTNLVHKIIDVIKQRMDKAERYGGKDVLNMSKFGEELMQFDIHISLANKAIVALIFEQLNGIEILKKEFRVFRFSENRINDLQPFSKLFGFTMNILDLSYNELDSTAQFMELKNIQIKELTLNGNPCNTIRNYEGKIYVALPSLMAIDGKPMNVQASTPPTKLPGIVQIDAKPNQIRKHGGAGNESILQFNDGILIRLNPKHREEFNHLKDTFPNYFDDSKWTQVIMQHDGAFRSDDILKEITSKLFEGYPFFPCYYKSYQNHDEFYLYKSFHVLRELMYKYLEYAMPNGKKIVFTLRLNAAQFKDGQVDWSQKLRYVLQKRYRDGVLDLSNFDADPEFAFMKTKLDSKYVLLTVIEKAKDANFRELNMQNNEISDLTAFTALFGIERLSKVDLRNNKISVLSGVPSSTQVKELMLDMNPFADIHPEPHKYVAEVLDFFTNLQWLDGYKVDKMLQIVTLRTFLVKRDAYTFAEEFVKIFFKFYDSFERPLLKQFYSDKSIFTMSIYCDYDPSLYPSTANYGSRIANYGQHFARNIRHISDMNRLSDKVFVGKAKITETFQNLPNTSHKPASFSIDVPVFHPNSMIIITVSGFFEELGRLLNEDSIVFGFSRTFILRSSDNNEYTILNDQLFINGASSERRSDIKLNVNKTVEPSRFKEICKDLLPSQVEEKRFALLLFQELTEMKEDECVRHLEEHDWKLHVALPVFNVLMDSHEIRDSQFDFK